MPAGSTTGRITEGICTLSTPAFGRRAVLTAAAALGLGFAGAAGVVAQESTPTATTACATALAIGNEGDSCVNVVHASPDAGAVDVALQGGDVLVENLEYPNASDYLLLPEGVYDLEVRPTGTEDVALDLSGTEVPAGATISFYAIGTAADGTLAALGVVGAPVTPDGAATPEA